MNTRPSWKDLARYVAGECSAAEQHEIGVWAGRDEANRRLIEDVRQTWTLARVPNAHRDPDLAWAKVRSQIQGPATPAPRKPIAFPRVADLAGRGGAGRWMRAAAIVALMGLPLAGLLWQVSAPAPGAADRFAAQEVITGNGEHARVRLIDGSEVALAPGSRLKVPGGLGRSTREVVLSGEAYFEVAPDSTRPFVVRARDGVTEVLGTEFNVRAYPEEPTIRVVVAEGKVLFRAARSAAETAKVLDQGDLGELESGKEEVISMAADLARDLAWRDGRLTFHETPLGEVARTIERWYGVPIQIADAGLASRRVTASFRHQPVEEVALVIAASLGLDCVRIGDAYVFRHQQEKSRVLAAE